MVGYIYLITDTTNNMKYVGETDLIKDMFLLVVVGNKNQHTVTFGDIRKTIRNLPFFISNNILK